MGGVSAQAACQRPPVLPSTSPDDGTWTTAQRQHATTIVTIGSQRGVPPRGWVIAVATAMQESGLRNLANSAVPRSLTLPHDGLGHDHDSVGVFQQRVSPPDGQGNWGSLEELMDPPTATDKFYTALLKVADWQKMRLTDAAQAVQKSGTPEAYQKWERPAEQLVAAIAGFGSISEIGGGAPQAPCGTAAIPPATVGPDGWVQPVHAFVGDRFGAPRPNGRRHAGVDLIAARNLPIRAAAAGVVTKVNCQSSTGTCDSDGNSKASGCGWYTEVTHALNVTYQGQTITSAVTRSCHMVTQPSVHIGQIVAAGDVLGFVGSSGGSSGPHLHWEVHLNPGSSVDSSNATDPEPWMVFVRSPLGQ
ncbi:MAG TPA: peptidase M23 [Micromonosporaceae bacterium]|nr:peptidase M23 [Micromonosporaceae bacterium]